MVTYFVFYRNKAGRAWFWCQEDTKQEAKTTALRLRKYYKVKIVRLD